MKAFVFWAIIQGILCSFASVSIAAPVSVFDSQAQSKGFPPVTGYYANRPIPAYLFAEASDHSTVLASRTENRIDKGNIDLAAESDSVTDEYRMSAVPIPDTVNLFITSLLAAGMVARKRLRRHRREAVSS